MLSVLPINCGHLVPRPPLQFTPCPTFEDASPLLKEKRNAGGQALVADIPNPLFGHRSRARSRFTAYDNPIDSAEVQAGKGPEQRFQGQELHTRARVAKMIDAVNESSILHTNAHPYVAWPLEIAI